MAGYSTVFEDVIFVEGTVPGARILGGISCDLSFKIGSQLKNLNDVKKALADRARALGANAVLDFRYGQKSRWLAIDDVAFFGTGRAAVLSETEYAKIREKIAHR